MTRLAHLLWGVAVMVLAAGCGAQAATPAPIEVTRIVEATREVEVTRVVEVTRIVPMEVTRIVEVTVVPVAAAATPTPEATAGSGCLAWDEAASHIGEQGCVEGFVTATNDTGRAFFINFDSSFSAFYAISFDHKFPGIEGSCVRVTGTIESYKGRPQIVIRDPASQLTTC